MELKQITELHNRYERNPLLKGLVQLIPFGIGASVDSAVQARLLSFRENRLRVFFDELDSGAIQLTDEIIKTDQFLHCYFSTLNSVIRTNNSEKIRYLARLLASTINNLSTKETDEYEELLSIVNDLSFRELTILSILAKYEKANPVPEGKNELQRAQAFWSEFSEDARAQYNLTEEMLHAILVRLQRSGCYEEFVGGYWGYTGGRGRLTKIYYKLEQLAGDVVSLDDK